MDALNNFEYNCAHMGRVGSGGTEEAHHGSPTMYGGTSKFVCSGYIGTFEMNLLVYMDSRNG